MFALAICVNILSRLVANGLILRKRHVDIPNQLHNK